MSCCWFILRPFPRYVDSPILASRTQVSSPGNKIRRDITGARVYQMKLNVNISISLRSKLYLSYYGILVVFADASILHELA